MSAAQGNQLEKLRGRENFDSWKISATLYLVIKGLWKYTQKELLATATEVERESDLKAKSELVLLIDPSNYSYVSDKQSAKEAWDAVVAAFEDSGVCRKVSLLQQLVSIKMIDCTSMEDYVTKVTILWSKVQAVGFALGEDVIGSLMLGGLPSEFRPMILGIENSGKEITLDFVKNLLLQEVMFDSTPGGSESAFFTKKDKGEKKSFKKKSKNIKCFGCGEPHLVKNCPNKNRREDKVLLTSFLVNENFGSDWYIDSGATAYDKK